MPLCGGMGEPKEATPEIQAMCDQLRGDLEQRAGHPFSNYKATHYASQVVAGTNYFVKIDVGDDKYAHVRIHKPLPHTNQGPAIASHQHPKTKEDALTYF